MSSICLLLKTEDKNLPSIHSSLLCLPVHLPLHHPSVKHRLLCSRYSDNIFLFLITARTQKLHVGSINMSQPFEWINMGLLVKVGCLKILLQWLVHMHRLITLCTVCFICKNRYQSIAFWNKEKFWDCYVSWRLFDLDLKYVMLSRVIKHDFLCTNMCWASRCWGAQKLVMYQKSMFDCYYCIKTFCRSKTLKEMLQNVLIFCFYNGAERFENTASRAKTNIILTLWHNICYCVCNWWWRQFLRWPRNAYMLNCKAVYEQHMNCLVNTWICAG